MAVESSLRKQQFSLDGTTSTLTFTFRALIAAPADIKVIVTKNSVDTALVYTTDFSVSVNANGIGGTVTLVSPSTVGSGTATVYRDTTNLQESDYDDYNQFPADTLETDLDIRTLVSQEQKEDLDRTLILPITVIGVNNQLPVPVAGKAIGWNSAATGLENKDIRGAITDITNSDGTITVTPTSGSVVVSLAAAYKTTVSNSDGTISANPTRGNIVLSIPAVYAFVDKVAYSYAGGL